MSVGGEVVGMGSWRKRGVAAEFWGAWWVGAEYGEKGRVVEGPGGYLSVGAESSWVLCVGAESRVALCVWKLSPVRLCPWGLSPVLPLARILSPARPCACALTSVGLRA